MTSRDYPGGIDAWRARRYDRGEVICYPINTEIERCGGDFWFHCSGANHCFPSLDAAEVAVYAMIRSWGEFSEMGI